MHWEIFDVPNGKKFITNKKVNIKQNSYLNKDIK